MEISISAANASALTGVAHSLSGVGRSAKQVFFSLPRPSIAYKSNWQPRLVKTTRSYSLTYTGGSTH